MLRLRCYVFGNLVREKRDRDLTVEETEFLERHRTECEDCRVRERTTNCSLDALKSSDIVEEQTEQITTRTILDNLGFNI
ncbi:MAG: hypothetical protein JST12_10105 [Armatimonadetes bacterium]|nr:hypothetical protein [Armatimonadota bacterium]MBS1702002.1 hypothetical protein [Armatimonadota bacterium]MBS1728157.1 hypothetical protein [Armatimonadota bacterium]